MRIVEIRANVSEDRAIGGYKVQYRVQTDDRTYSITRTYSYDRLHTETLLDNALDVIKFAIKDALARDR